MTVLHDNPWAPPAAALRVEFPIAGFRGAFAAVARAVPAKSPRLALLSVRLDLAPGMAVFSATNLEVWVRHRLACGYAGPPASILLDRGKLTEMLRFGVGETIALVADPDHAGTQVQVKVGTRSWTLPTGDPAAFPTCPAADLVAYHEVESPDLARAIKRTVKETRPGLDHDNESSVIQLEPLMTGFTLTSGNGKSLAHQKLAATQVGPPPDLPDLPLVPESAVRTLSSLLAKAGPAVRIGWAVRNHAQFDVGDCTLLARLSEGQFMKWRPFLAVFPRPTGTVALRCETLRLAVAAAAISMDDESRRIELTFVADPIHPAEGDLMLSSESSHGAADVHERVQWEGEDVQVSLDPQYVMNMLEALGNDTEIALAIYPGNVPLKITTEDGFLGLSQLMGERG